MDPDAQPAKTTPANPPNDIGKTYKRLIEDVFDIEEKPPTGMLNQLTNPNMNGKVQASVYK